MQKFLSVDIDYWQKHKEASIALRPFLAELTKEARKRKIPLSAVQNHHQMIDLVNMSPARHLFNIDAHSDLASKRVQDFNCGTWISYVTWRKEGKYEWFVPPHARTYGDCNGDPYIFEENRIQSKLSDWKTLVRTDTSIVPSVSELLNNCLEVCVCMSPSYADRDQKIAFKEWVSSNNIPYITGVNNEVQWNIDGRRPSYYENKEAFLAALAESKSAKNPSRTNWWLDA